MLNSSVWSPEKGWGFQWEPKRLTIREGDTVVWAWEKKDSFSQLKFNVFQTASGFTNSYNGNGFNSGAKTSLGMLDCS